MSTEETSNGKTNVMVRQSSVSVALTLNTLPALREFCAVLAQTEMVPKGYRDKPDNILVAMIHGQELGLPPLQALQSIAVVNGVPSIYGDAGLALVRGSGKLEDFDEWFEVDGVRQDGSSFPIQKWAEEGKAIVAVCMSKRIGAKRPRITTYSVNDAKRAGLWAKEGTWQTVPQRMLMWRPRSWNLRDEFGDVLKGLAIYEEAMDLEATPGADGVYRPAVEPVPAGQTDADMQRVQEALAAKALETPTEKPAEKPATAAHKQKPVADSANDTRANLKEIPKEEWDDLIRQIDEDPDLRDIKAAVKKSMNITTLKLIGPGQHEFLRRMRAEAGKQGYGDKIKAIIG